MIRRRPASPRREPMPRLVRTLGYDREVVLPAVMEAGRDGAAERSPGDEDTARVPHAEVLGPEGTLHGRPHP